MAFQPTESNYYQLSVYNSPIHATAAEEIHAKCPTITNSELQQNSRPQQTASELLAYHTLVHAPLWKCSVIYVCITTTNGRRSESMLNKHSYSVRTVKLPQLTQCHKLSAYEGEAMCTTRYNITLLEEYMHNIIAQIQLINNTPTCSSCVTCLRTCTYM